jgi:hypothetical protein
VTPRASGAIGSSTTGLVGLVLALVVVILGFVVPSLDAGANSPPERLPPALCDTTSSVVLDGAELSARVAGSGNLVATCAYDDALTPAADDVGALPGPILEVSAAESTPLYRGMKPGEGGLPEVGPSASTLGA